MEKLDRFKSPAEAIADSPVMLWHATREPTEKPASLWPGGRDAGGPGAVQILGHTITLVAMDRDSCEFKFGKVTLLLSDGAVRVIADVGPEGGTLEGTLGTNSSERPMDPDLAAQIFQEYSKRYTGKRLTINPPAERDQSEESETRE